MVYQINKYCVERVQSRMIKISTAIHEICKIVQDILKEVEIQEPRFISSLVECAGTGRQVFSLSFGFFVYFIPLFVYTHWRLVVVLFLGIQRRKVFCVVVIGIMFFLSQDVSTETKDARFLKVMCRRDVRENVIKIYTTVIHKDHRGKQVKAIFLSPYYFYAFSKITFYFQSVILKLFSTLKTSFFF